MHHLPWLLQKVARRLEDYPMQQELIQLEHISQAANPSPECPNSAVRDQQRYHLVKLGSINQLLGTLADVINVWNIASCHRPFCMRQFLYSILCFFVVALWHFTVEYLPLEVSLSR